MDHRESVERQESLFDLPKTRRSWKETKPLWKHWENLRPFFASHGFRLYHTYSEDQVELCLRPRESSVSATRSFELFGDMSRYQSEFITSTGINYAARDERDRDVVIKAIHEIEGGNELDVLRFLNSEPLQNDIRNNTVPVLRFLSYGDWCFVVTPMWTSCYSDDYSLCNVAECLEFGKQILQGITFLHQCGIAHQDIAFENIMIDVHGKESANFRSSNDVRYALIDFGNAFRFDNGDSGYISKPLKNDRRQRSPEVTSGAPCNLLASDVYMTGRFLYSWFKAILPDVPGLLELLQDMTELEPSHRPPASEAADRFCNLHSIVEPDQRHRAKRQIDINKEYPPVPRDNFRIELPKTMQEWAEMSSSEFSRTWEALRPFFAERGYILFDRDIGQEHLRFTRGPASPTNAWGPAGDRSELVTLFPIQSRKAYVARSAIAQQDALIKLVGIEGHAVEETKILRRLEEPDAYCRLGIPLTELLTCGSYHFAVWFLWQDCATPPPITIEECFVVIGEALEKLQWLHNDGIAHLDLHPAKFRMPIYGKAPLDFRTSMRAKYLYTGFSKAHRFPENSDPGRRLLPPRLSLRPNKAPELDGKTPFNPFAADIYMLARMLYALFKTIVPDAPGLLALLQDMSSPDPVNRISLITALERFHDIKRNVSKDNLVAHRFDIVYDIQFPLIPSILESVSASSSSDIERPDTPISIVSDAISVPGDTSFAKSNTSATTSLQSEDEETPDKADPPGEARLGDSAHRFLLTC